jgi:thiaminase/transcriptional activator TenA
LQAARPSPTNLAYINHMVRTASEEGLGATAAALLPCPWTYHLLGELLLPTEHPVYSLWTSFYTEGGLEHSVAAWRSYVDTEAAQARPRDRESMRRAFITSSRYEWMFWRMAYQMEAWPV